jgi:dynein heavy chain
VTLLEEKRLQLRILEAQLSELHQKLKEANQQKQELEDNVTMCSNKLMRAEKLIGKLKRSHPFSPQN